MQMMIANRLFMTRIALTTVLAVCPIFARAECTMNFSTPEVNLGESSVDALAASEIAGYRRMARMGSTLLTIDCDANRAGLTVQVNQVTGIGGDLLRWDATRPDGAIRMKIVRATADGAAVSMQIDGKAPVEQLDIDRDHQAVTLRMSPARGTARNFSLEIQFAGFVSSDFVPIGKTALVMTPQFVLSAP
jgi:hypothetical protein